MSKLVNWGHWIAGGVFAVLGLRYLIEGLLSLPTLIRILRGETSSYFIPGGVVLWIPFLLCAWGIWRWRRWGYTLAFVLCSLVMAALGRWLAIVDRPSITGFEVVVTVLTLCIFLWLLIPAVRTLYWRGNLTT